MINLNHQQSGYVFLLSVLVLGAVATAVVGSFLILGIASLQTGQSLEKSSQAFAFAQTCAERALNNIFDDIEYTGNESLTFEEGTCDILVIGGSGNNNRTICTEGTSKNATRRLQIIVERVLPSISVYSWEEVSIITACSYL